MGFFRRDASFYFSKAARCLASNPRGALAYFEKSAEVGEGDGMLHYNIAECLTKESATQPDLRVPALHYLDKAINLLEPSHPFWDASHLMRGNLRIRFGMIEEALADYNKAAERRPENPEVYYRRGLAYWKLLDLKRAEADLSKAVTLGQRFPFSTLFETTLGQLK